MEGRTKVLIVGGAIGAILGVAGAWIFLNRPSDDEEGTGKKRLAPASIGWKDLIQVGLAVLTLMRQIADLGRRPRAAARGGRRGS